MESLILQAFKHIADLGPLVAEGRYDLVGPDQEIILPQIWETMVKPDMSIEMKMWPQAKKEKLQMPFPPGHPGLQGLHPMNMEFLAGPPGKKDKEARKKEKEREKKFRQQMGMVPPPPPLGPELDGMVPPPPQGIMPLPPGVEMAFKKAKSSSGGSKKKSSSSSKGGGLFGMFGGAPAKKDTKKKK